MKTNFILALSLIMLLSCSKEPKEVVINPHDVNELTNLEVLCQVWGLVKYHHPAFMVGSTHDDDADLLELIPKIRGADAVTRNQILLDWINGLGAYSSSKNGWDVYVKSKRLYSQTTTPVNMVEMSWIEDDYILGKALSAELPKVRYASRLEGSKYVRMEGTLPSFIEEEYAHITNPSVEYRLLALFRYWNIVEYFYPLKNLLPGHWNNVLTDHIPLFIEATERLEYRKAMARLITETCDEVGFVHERDIVPVFGNRKVSSGFFTTSIIEDKLIVTSASTEVQIKRGDEIVSMGGRSLSDVKRLILEYLKFSNEGNLLNLMNFYATTTNDLTLSVTYLSDGELKTEDFPTLYQYREEPSQEVVSTRAFPVAYTLAEGGGIGYINGAYYSASEASAMMNSLKETKGIIIDLRGSIQNMLPLAYGYFTNSVVWCLEWGQVDPMTPGIIYIYSQSNDWFSANYMTYSGKVVIIVNESTGGVGEAGAVVLQTIPGVITIGSQTVGGFYNSNQIVFPGNISTRMTNTYTRSYNGRELQLDGVPIDIEVKPTIAGIKAGRDELYEKAVELILN